MSFLDELPDSVRRRAVGLLLIVAAIGWFSAAYFAGCQVHAAQEKRDYHAYPISEVTAQNVTAWGHPLTHLEIEGYVTYIDHEADGDWHIRLCDSPGIEGMDRQHCMVAECIPKLPCDVPKHGEQVRVQGIYRYDGEAGHRWAEVHPVEYLEVIQ